MQKNSKKIVSLIKSSFSVTGFEPFTSELHGRHVPYLVQNQQDDLGCYICPITSEVITPEIVNKGFVFALTSKSVLDQHNPIVFIFYDQHNRFDRGLFLKQDLKETHPITREPLSMSNLFQVRRRHWSCCTQYPYVLASVAGWNASDFQTTFKSFLPYTTGGMNPADIYSSRESIFISLAFIFVYRIATPEQRFFLLPLLFILPFIAQRHQGQR